MNNEEVSNDRVASTRRTAAQIHSVILRKLAEVTQARAAECMGIDASTVSRMKADLEDVCLLLAAIGLEISDADSMVVSKEDLFALQRLGYQYLKMQVEGRQ